MTYNDRLPEDMTDADLDTRQEEIIHWKRVEQKLDNILAITERVETLAQTVAGQVKPVLDDLMKSPLLKMLGVKTK